MMKIVKTEDMKNPKGMYWNGTRYVKAKGSGTYDGGMYYKEGGNVKPAPIYVSDPKDPRLQAYNDSLNLYKAYEMQDRLMGPGNKVVTKNISPYDWSLKELKDRRTNRFRPGFDRAFSDDFKSEQHQFRNGYDGYTARKVDKQLLDYYKKLGFKEDQIMYHSSPDIASDKIRPIGTYYDGTAQSPIYKKPVQKVVVDKGPEDVVIIDGFTGKEFRTHYNTQREADSAVNSMLNPKYQNGGQTPTAFWNLPNPTSNPGAEGMVDYGSMYSLPNRGLFQKSTDSEWEEFGNPANLMNQPRQPQMQSIRSMQPMQKATVNKKSFYEADGEGDYSIDAVRSQYMNGGNIEVPYMAGQPKLSYGGVLGRQYNNPQYTHVTGLARYGGVLGNQYNNPEYTHVTGLMKDGGIHIKPENRGKFTAWAQSHGMGVQEAASHVMANKDDYSSTIVKRANFARNFGGNKRQYGGPTRYDIGGVTEENPMGGATMFTGQNPAGTSTTVATETTYDPATDPNNPVNQNIPIPQQGGYAAAQGAAYDTTGITHSQPDQAAPPTGPRQPFGTGYRNLLGAAMMYGQYAADRRQQKGLKAYGIQQGMTQMNPVSNPWSKGQYNQQGQLSAQFQSPGRFGRYGGDMTPQYAVGGEYDMDDNMIEELKRKGYKLKMI